MSRSTVDSYEQVLAQDPASMVFLDLARACLEVGANSRAIEVCQLGLAHHPDSVVGRVLWGKALISQGRAAEAMQQFDLATAIDRENPQAYTLISEALLRQGLYRSAMPILRKAAALQPSDARIARWLEQTRAAVSGGPPPELGEPDPAPPGAGPASADASPPAVASPAGGLEATGAPPDRASTPGASPASARPSLPPIDPAVFAAFTAPAAEPDAEPTERNPTPDGASGDSRSTLGLPVFDPQGEGEPTLVVGGALLDELPPAPDPFAAFIGTPVAEALPAVEAARQAPRQPAPPVLLPSTPRPRGLLADIPESAAEVPGPRGGRPDLSNQASEAIAREYERELREKLEASKQQKTLLQRRGLPVALAAAALVVAVGLGGSFWLTRSRNQGETLDTAQAKALAAIAADTREQYLVAVHALEQALAMDDGNPAVLASLAYANAMLFAEHGGDPAPRAAALAALTPRVRAAFPAEALVVDFLTADAASAPAQRQRLLDAGLEKSLVHAHAGRLLLRERRPDEALTHLKKAVELDPRQTLALVALGDYYLAFEDWDGALEMMARAEPLARFSPARVLGHAEARLELGKELPEALGALETLPANAAVPEALKPRATLLLGRAQSANGRHEEALKTLQEGLASAGRGPPARAFPFQMALGHAERAAGRMDRAQHAFEEASKLLPRSEEAREGLGRVLLARSREKELLDRLKPEKDQRKVALLRGIAWSRLGEPRKAREELKGTQVGGKVPAEAAVYLALADAAEEAQTDKAVEMLERLAAARPRGKATVQVALARVYLQRNQLDRARAQLEEAARDPLDYEANTLLGQLLLDGGAPPEQALEPLQRAVEHNGSHGPARHLLVRALLALGRTGDALHQVDAWTADNPSSDQAWRDAALASLEAGKLDDAQAALGKLPPGVEDAEAFRLRARVLFARGDPQAGMTALERANKLNPHDAETFCEIGHALVRQGLYELAPKAYRKAVEENARSTCGRAGPFHAQPTSRGKPSPREFLAGLVTPATPAWERGFVLATRARVNLDARDLAAAQADAEAATAAAPGSAAAWYALGEVRHRQKSEDQARAAFEKAAALDGSWAAAHLALAEALHRQGGEALPRALAGYERVADLDQSEAEAGRARRAAAALKKQLK